MSGAWTRDWRSGRAKGGRAGEFAASDATQREAFIAGCPTSSGQIELPVLGSADEGVPLGAGEGQDRALSLSVGVSDADRRASRLSRTLLDPQLRQSRPAPRLQDARDRGSRLLREHHNAIRRTGVVAERRWCPVWLGDSSLCRRLAAGDACPSADQAYEADGEPVIRTSCARPARPTRRRPGADDPPPRELVTDE